MIKIHILEGATLAVGGEPISGPLSFWAENANIGGEQRYLGEWVITPSGYVQTSSWVGEQSALIWPLVPLLSCFLVLHWLAKSLGIR